MLRLYSKRFHISTHDIIAILIILFAISLRLVLTAFGVPATNSDEGTMGLEAMHIAFRGEHPVFFYGQNYMGVLEAYLAAGFFHLFGVSLFSLRLGLILLFLLFLLSMYRLTSLLYSKKLALVTLLLLSFGSSDVFIQELRAVGGAVETLLFGSLALLLALWLALPQTPTSFLNRPRNRVILYGCWGFVAGIGLWSHVLVLPFVLAGGILLLLFCRQELRTRVVAVLLVGFLLGASPLILYNLTVPPWAGTFATAWNIQHASNLGNANEQNLPIRQVIGTMLYSLPVATGLDPNVCSYTQLPLSGTENAHTLPCAIFYGGWGLGYVLLLALSLIFAAKPLWKMWRLRRLQTTSKLMEEKSSLVLNCARLLLLSAATITLLLYLVSPVSALKPWSTRYLIGLLIATPAILWPLYRGMTIHWKPGRPQGDAPPIHESPSHAVTLYGRGVPLRAPWPLAPIFTATILLVICATLLLSTGITLNTISETQANQRQQEALIQNLLRIGATRVYSGYWTCYQLMFQSQERIICSIPKGLIQPGADRYLPYRAVVESDARAAYIFVQGSDDDKAFAKKMQQSSQHYNQFVFDGYRVYQPSNNSP